MKMIQKLKRGDAGTTGLALEKYGKFGVDGNSGVLWYLTQLSTIFQLYRGGKLYWWRKPNFISSRICMRYLLLDDQPNRLNIH
jgi:hypothetical protein